MSTQNRQKRLLILGGQRKLCDIVQKARELGYYTIVTDWYEDSPAKSLADKACQVSTSDEDALLHLVEEEQIDGIYTGFLDATLVYYYNICQIAGLPCFLSEELLRCGTDKRYFKKKCLEYGIETIPEYRITPRNFEKKVTRMDFPVLIKPVDNSGSKGITVCSDEWSFRKAYDRALRFSRSKDVIVERFMCCDYVAAYYCVRNGKCQLTMLMDKDMNRIGRGCVPIPTAFVSPSIYYERYVQEVDPAVCRMVADMGYQNGTFLISFFVSGHHFYGVELTTRLAATREYEFIEDQTGLDILAEQIRNAVGDGGADEDLPNICKKMNERVNCTLLVFLKEGIIGKIEGISEILRMRGVLNVLQLRREGDMIRADGSYGQFLARIYLTAENKVSMLELINAVKNKLSVTDANGHSQMIEMFDADRFFRNT